MVTINLKKKKNIINSKCLGEQKYKEISTEIKKLRDQENSIKRIN